MTENSTFSSLAKTTGIGLLSGFVAGVWVFFTIQSDAAAHALTLEPMQRDSYLCGAGMAASFLALLSVPAGALFGLSLGAIFIARKRAAARRPLP